MDRVGFHLDDAAVPRDVLFQTWLWAKTSDSLLSTHPKALESECPKDSIGVDQPKGGTHTQGLTHIFEAPQSP